MEDFDDLKKTIGIVLLAAGASARLGKSKQLLDVGGEAMLKRAAETAIACTGNNAVVVLGSRHELHEKVIAHLPLHVVVNENWTNGMGSSLKAGLAFLWSMKPDLQAIVVMVCDQPLVTKAHLEKILDAFARKGAKIIASSYSSTAGVPALFHCSLFDSIMKLGDQHGAKKIIESGAEPVETIDFPGGEVDIDTPEDYHNFKLTHQQDEH